MEFEVARMEPLFANRREYEEFLDRQKAPGHNRRSPYKGNCFLGIDAGSTTTKAAVISEDGELLYSFYDNNHGSPLATSIRAIQEIYRQAAGDARSPMPAPPATASS